MFLLQQMYANSPTLSRMLCHRALGFRLSIVHSAKSIEVHDVCLYHRRLPHLKSTATILPKTVTKLYFPVANSKRSAQNKKNTIIVILPSNTFFVLISNRIHLCQRPVEFIVT